MGLGGRAIEPIMTIATPPSRYERTVAPTIWKLLSARVGM